MPEMSNVEVLKAEFLTSAVRRDQWPVGEYPEFAFIGRSNVGKSSLINSICRHRGLAKTSGTPGKTQTINYFLMHVRLADQQRHSVFLVDLPGYGYAKRSRDQRKSWGVFIEEYFLMSQRLEKIFQLVDIRHEPQESDLDMYHWLVENHLPVQVVVTKADKLSRSQIKKHVDVIRNGLATVGPAPHILVHSSSSGQGREDLLDVIGEFLIK